MSASNRPAFRAIADQIRAAIEAGTYAPGSKLPTDAELATKYGVTRTLIGDALQLLTTDGIVTKTRKGTLVSSLDSKIVRDANTRYTKRFREAVAADGAPARGAFDAEIRGLGMIPKTDLTVSRDVPPNDVAELLGIPANEVLVVSRARVMYAVKTDGEGQQTPIPVQVATSYLPGDIAFGTALETNDTGPGGLISRLAEFGVEQASVTEKVDARRPTESEARALGLTEDQRVYQVTHVGRTAAGRAVEVTVHVLPVHLWTLMYAWDMDAWSRVTTPAAGNHASGPALAASVRRSGRIYGEGEYARIVSAAIAPAPADVAQALGLDEGCDALRRLRITHSADDKPISASASWYRPELGETAPRLLETERITEGSWSYLEAQTGLRATVGEDLIDVRLATAEDQELLQVPEGSPVKVNRTHLQTADGTTIEYGVSVSGPGRATGYGYNLG